VFVTCQGKFANIMPSKLPQLTVLANRSIIVMFLKGFRESRIKKCFFGALLIITWVD
jgi:hypothetical protein